MKDRDLKKAFGISLEQYNKMFEEQNGVCAICHKPETLVRLGKLTKLRVDHSHVTEKVRGLLCNNCNTALGHLLDSPELLIKAAQYLHSFRD